VDYRSYTWESEDEVTFYYSMAARMSDIIIGFREEFDFMETMIHPNGRTGKEMAN
jgi:5-dehydro-2-deoxygluconokinase